MKKTNNILKGAGVLLIAAVMILSTFAAMANTNFEQKEMKTYEHVDLKTTGTTEQLISKGVFSDSFEAYPDFVVDNFPPWTTYDGDGGATWGVDGMTWPNVGYEGSFMIFNPSMTDPPFDSQPPHSGEKYASCWDAVTASAPNDDWLFTPQLHMEEDGMLSFWGKSLNDAYGLEEIEYGISTTDTDPASFTIVSGPVIDVPVTWTEYTYDLSAYTGQDIYIGIHVVSFDHFAFFLDDFEVTGVEIPDPVLNCEGDIDWTEVEPGATVTEDFTVMNDGEAGSMLNWEIDSYPTDWGTDWEFTPESGVIAGESSVSVDVSVVAPPDEETTFTGTIVIINSDDPAETCEISVSLETPVSQITTYSQSQTNLVKSYSNQASPVGKDIVWDNGADAAGANYYSSQNDLVYPFISQVADDFLLEEETEITDVHWWGGFWNGPPDEVDPLDFDIIFYADDGTGYAPTGGGMNDPTPTALAVYQFQGVTGYPLSPNGNYEYNVDLDTPFTAQAGVKYWIAIVAVFPFPPQWGWANTDGMQLSNAVQGFPLAGLVYWSNIDPAVDMAFYLTSGGGGPSIPDLDCYGDLDFGDVETESELTATITVENVGDADSLLDWSVQSWPDFGTWTFDPASGVDLPYGSTTIDVTVTVPADQETEFTGQVVLVNDEDPDDICIIDVSLTTPHSQSLIAQFFERIVERFPILGLILEVLL